MPGSYDDFDDHVATDAVRRRTGPESPRRPRVLLSAYSCGPQRGSEPGIGWNRAVEISRYAEVWVVVNQEWESRIRQYLDKHDDHAPRRLRFVFVPRTRLEKFFARTRVMLYAAYNLWQRRAFRRVSDLHRQMRFDLAHQVTYIGFREPSYLYLLDAPFIWGPVGGTQNYPFRLLFGAGLAGALREACRSLSNVVQLHFSRRVKRAARSADRVLAASSSIAHDFFRSTGVTPQVLPDVSIARRPPNEKSPPRKAGGLRILWSGVLEERKALELLIEALALIDRDVAFELRVLGEGRCRKRWQRLAQRRDVDDKITWLGNVDHDEALAQFDWADVFVFTSLRDTTGTVLAEALAAATPVICLDHQGGKDVVIGGCGVKIPVAARKQIARRLSEALVELARNPETLEAYAKAAQRRAEYYWSDAHGMSFAETYNAILADRGSDARCRAWTDGESQIVDSGWHCQSHPLSSNTASHSGEG